MLDRDQEFDQDLNPSSPARPAPQAGPSLADPEAYAQEPARNGSPSTMDDDVFGPSLEQGADVRDQAESAYQRIASEILESTNQVCQKLIADGETVVERARLLEAEAELTRQEAQKELDKARVQRVEAEQTRQEAQKELDKATVQRVEAEAFKEKALAAVSEAHQRAQEILEWARAEADNHLAKVRQAAAAEADKLLAEAHAAQAAAKETLALRAAAQQEMEAQKLYTEAARLRLKAESRDTLTQLREQIDGLLSSTSDPSSQSRTAPNRAKKPQGKVNSRVGVRATAATVTASAGRSQTQPSENNSPLAGRRLPAGPAYLADQ